MELSKAQTICMDVAAEAKRWGKHAGFASYHPDDVKNALIACFEAGLFELTGEKDARIQANKNAGAAKARAARAQKMVDDLKEEVAELKEQLAEMQDIIDFQKKIIEGA